MKENKKFLAYLQTTYDGYDMSEASSQNVIDQNSCPCVEV